MKNFIRLTSTADGKQIFVNINHIGHFYNMSKEIGTNLGVTTHNNGGFKVMETPEEIAKLINESK